MEKKNSVVQKSSFQMKVNFAFHLEIKVPESGEEWRGTESMLLEVQCEVSTVSDDLGCHVICWCGSHCVFLKSTVNAAIYQEMLKHFMLPSADKLYGDADFFFPVGLGTYPPAKSYQKLVQ